MTRARGLPTGPARRWATLGEEPPDTLYRTHTGQPDHLLAQPVAALVHPPATAHAIARTVLGTATALGLDDNATVAAAVMSPSPAAQKRREVLSGTSTDHPDPGEGIPRKLRVNAEDAERGGRPPGDGHWPRRGHEEAMTNDWSPPPRLLAAVLVRLPDACPWP